MKLNLNLVDTDLHSESDRPQTHQFSSNRNTLRKGLDLRVVQMCLDSLDVFRDLLQGIPQQKNRVVRDVCKNIELKNYLKGEIIYEIGEKAQQVYFCVSGEVSICLLKEVPKSSSVLTKDTKMSGFGVTKKQSLKISRNQLSPSECDNMEMEMVEDEIQVVESGIGFGEGEFISGTKRRLRAITKTSQALIGKLQIDHFAEVLENYKQRVYYKKRDMFMKCSLFSNLNQQKLEFIINNTKPMSLCISQKLVKQGNPVDFVYLVNKGQISLWKTGVKLEKHNSSDDEDNNKNRMSSMKRKKLEKQKMFERLSQNHHRTYSQTKRPSKNLQRSTSPLSESPYPKTLPSIFKLKHQKLPLIPQQSDNKVFMGQMSQGCFIGDLQLVLQKPFSFNAICKTEKAEIYYCDRRIILSQITESALGEVKKYYEHKQAYLNDKVSKYKSAKQNVEKQKEKDLLPPLTKQQIEIKRKIMHRHVEDKTTLIGQCSPKQIFKMIKRKQARVIKQPEMSKSPILQLFPNFSVKRRTHSPTSFSPLALVQTQCKRSSTEPDIDLQKYGTLEASPNPQNKDPIQNFNLKSILIRIKHWYPDLKQLKHDRQKNLLKVGKILGRYRQCDSRLKDMSHLIEKIQNNRI